MSVLDAEQSARYIDTLVASVQALEADLAATRDKLREAEAAAQAEAFYQCESELGQAQARIAALEQEAERLRWTVRNIRLTAALGRSFGHQATPQTPEKMSERKDKALDKVLGFCADAGETGSILREAQANARGREE